MARNEASFRLINERLERGLRELGLVDGTQPFVCECGSADCDEPVELSIAEYEAVRDDPRHFAVRPGHELPEIENVVVEGERYTVVRKVNVAARISELTDPRA